MKRSHDNKQTSAVRCNVVLGKQMSSSNGEQRNRGIITGKCCEPELSQRKTVRLSRKHSCCRR